MLELIKRLLRWIIFAIIVILLILLLVKLFNKKDNVKKNLDSGVKVIKKTTDDVVDKTKETLTYDKKEEEKKEENETTTSIDRNANERVDTNNPTPSNQTTVNAPDTASSADLMILLGTVLLGSNTYYLYKKRNS